MLSDCHNIRWALSHRLQMRPHLTHEEKTETEAEECQNRPRRARQTTTAFVNVALFRATNERSGGEIAAELCERRRRVAARDLYPRRGTECG